MKKNLFYSAIITTAVLIVSQTLSAQNTAPYWSQAGNLNGNPSARLGTLDATPLNLSTNNITRMHISPQGNIGIGTAAPVQQLHVAGNTFLSGNLGIGTAEPSQQLHVVGNTYISGNLGIGMSIPAYKFAVDGTGSTLAIAGFSNYLGVYGSGNTYGLYGTGNYFGVYGTGTHYGIYGQSTDGYAAVFNSTNGVGLYAATSRSDRNYAAVFQGNVYTIGTFNSSDKDLKKNIEELGNAMSIIKKLKPKYYEFKQDGKYAGLHLPQGKHFGLLAQEVETVLPGLVKEAPIPLMENNQTIEPLTADGQVPSSLVSREGKSIQSSETINIKAVNYTELIPILVKALQEQDERIEQQQQQISDLKQLVSKLTNGQTTSTSLSNGVLLQNVPNPVKGNTSISYDLPDGVSRAQLIVTDALGRSVKTLQLTKSGVVNLDVSSLSSGVYNYSLAIDNKIIQTRKMTIKR